MTSLQPLKSSVDLANGKLTENKTKQDLKKLLQSITQGSNEVKLDVFLKLATLHGITLSKKSADRILKQCCTKNDSIQYREALKLICQD